MKRSVSQLHTLLADLVGIASSRQRLKQLRHISLYSNAIYLILASAATSVLGLVFWIVAARFYSTEQVGLASAVVAAAGLVTAFSTLGLDMGLVRFLPHSENPNSVINTAFTIGAISSAITTFVFVVGLGFWSPSLVFVRQDLKYLAAFVILCIIYQTWNLLVHVFIAKRRASFATAQSLISNLLKFPMVILLAASSGGFGIFVSWGGSLVLAFLVGMFWFLPRAQPGYRPFFTINRQVVKATMRFSFANYVSTLFWMAPGMVLPIIVINILGAESNAYFYIAWAIGIIIPLVIGAVTTSLLAEGSHDEKTLGLNTRRSLKMMFIILVPAVMLVLGIAPQLLRLFGGPYAENGTTLLRLFAVSSFSSIINITYIIVKRVEKKLKALLGFTAAAGAGGLGLACLLLPWMGINGAGVAWLATQSVLALAVVRSLLKGQSGPRVDMT